MESELTNKQSNVLAATGTQLKQAFPDFYGNIQFNMSSKAENIKVHVTEHFYLKPGKQVKENEHEDSC